MAAIYEEDQRPRQSPSLTAAELDGLAPLDLARRNQVRGLLERGELRAAEDFRKAAFIFQHGTTPDDFQLAHSLALIALTKGDTSSAWIAAASFDRFLWSIGKPQIYGTQFGNTGTQDPFERTIVSDELRRELHVPPLSDQVSPFTRQK